MSLAFVAEEFVTCPVPLHLVQDECISGLRPYRMSSLVRIRPGVYADTREWNALTPWERYLVRVYAVARTLQSPVFCLESAAALQGLPLFGEPRLIHLLDPGGKSRRLGEIAVHSTRSTVRVDQRSGLIATSVPDTAEALARVLPPSFALACVDAALRWMRENEFPEELPRDNLSRRGLRQLAWVRERATGDSESPGESVSRAVIEWLGYPLPELQVTFSLEGHTDRTDFWWHRDRIVGEFDGYAKYSAEKAATRAQLLAEKVREDRLRRHVDGLARWDWKDAITGDGLDRKLRQAGLTPTQPTNPALLSTLNHNQRSFNTVISVRSTP